MNLTSVKTSFIATLLIFSTGCSFMGMPKTGRVVNMETMEPIEGAIVVLKWKGVGGIVDATTTCYQVKTDITNNSGKYYTGVWFGFDAPVWHTDIIPYAYKEGFIKPQVMNYNGYDYLMTPFRGTREERFAYLERLLSATTCADAGVSYKNLYRIRKAIYEEAMKLAISKEEKELAEGFGYSAASVIADELIDPRRPQEEQDKVIEKILRDNP